MSWCNGWDIEHLDLLIGLTLGFYQQSPEVWNYWTLKLLIQLWLTLVFIIGLKIKETINVYLCSYGLLYTSLEICFLILFLFFQVIKIFNRIRVKFFKENVSYNLYLTFPKKDENEFPPHHVRKKRKFKIS